MKRVRDSDSLRDHDNKRARNADNVRNHYNSRPEMGRSGREQSRIISLRDFNNWVKSVLIANVVVENQNCFDMCCGKGGDLLKWAYVNAGFLFACDIAEKSIADAKQRSLNMRNRPFRAQFEVADMSKIRIADTLLPRARETNELIEFDSVSCQFGIHYGFETRESCKMFFQNATDRLRKDGFFFGTVPNAVKLVRMLKEAQQKDPGCMSFGSDLYTVEFKSQPTSSAEFGVAYDFTLTSAVNACTEYLVHPAVFRAMGEQHGLELVLYQGFHEFYEREIRGANRQQAMKLLDRMVFRHRTEVPKEQWQIAGLYNVFCFRKKTDAMYTPAPPATDAVYTPAPPATAEQDDEPDPW